MVHVFIPKERRRGETRVAATPETVRKMVKAGLEVTVEHGAGLEAFFPDAEYEAAGAQLTGDPGPAAARADAVLTVTAPEAGDAAALKPGSLLVGLLAPHRNLDLVRTLAERRGNPPAPERAPPVPP